MPKISWKPGTMVYPVPAVLISCGTEETNDINIFTVAWIGTICTNPAMLSISVRPERYSYEIMQRHGQFTVNLTTESMVKATDWCGVRSGRDYDKFKESGLTPINGIANSCPLIEESPLSIECRIKESFDLGSHDMFISEVVNVVADDRYISPATGAFEMERAGLVAFCHGKYYALGEMLGSFGFSVKKNKTRSKK